MKGHDGDQSGSSPVLSWVGRWKEGDDETPFVLLFFMVTREATGLDEGGARENV